MNFREFYEADLSRYQTVDKYNKKWHKYFRKAQFCSNTFLKRIYRFKLKKIINEKWFRHLVESKGRKRTFSMSSIRN